MVVLWDNIPLSKKEIMILEALKDKNQIKDAKNELKKQGINLPAAYKTLESVQRRGSQAMQLVNQILGYRRSSKAHHGLLEERLQFHS